MTQQRETTFCKLQGHLLASTFMNTAPRRRAYRLLCQHNQYRITLLSCWNASAAILSRPSGSNPAYSANGWFWRPGAPTTIPWTTGIEWSVPIATNISGVAISPNMSINAIADNTLLLISAPSGTYENYQIEAGYNLINGAQLFIVNRTVPTMDKGYHNFRWKWILH